MMRLDVPGQLGLYLIELGANRLDDGFNPDCSLGRGMMARRLAWQFGCG